MIRHQAFNIQKALLLAKMSRRAYDPFEKDYLSFAMDLKNDGFRLTASFVNNETDTEGFLVENDELAVLCFRGTMEIPLDIFTDVTGKIVNGVHEGIFKGFNSVRPQIEAKLRMLGNKPIFCTGHSLGGGLAKMAILNLPDVSWAACYTFGSPPICDLQVGSRNLVPTYRIVNEGDIVPRMMEIKAIGELGGTLVSVLNKLVNGKEVRLAQISDAEAYIQQMKMDLQNYCHIGEVRFFNRDGRSQTAKEFMQVFSDAIKGNWAAAIEDHKITQYVVNIERYIGNSIMLEPNLKDKW